MHDADHFITQLISEVIADPATHKALSHIE